MTQPAEILIASSSYDRPVFEPVEQELTRRGFNCIVYEADKVVSGEHPLTIAITSEHGLSIHCDGGPYEPQAVGAAWYRRPSDFGPEIDDKAKMLGIVAENKSLQHVLWSTVDEERWLNAPNRIQAAEYKLGQLVLAQSMGFTIPDTITTNQWDSVKDMLPQDIIMKMPRGHLYVDNKSHTLGTIPLKNNNEGLPLQASPFPGIYQPHLSKMREWRITLVGSDSFDAAIYTSENAKDDWRKHQHTNSVQFAAEQFDPQQKELCFKFLEALGLQYGTFDFVETADGRIVFLELNPNGQYMWLEQQLGLPISQAIASKLASIALDHAGYA